MGPGLEENSLATDMSSDTGSLDSDAGAREGVEVSGENVAATVAL